MKITYLLLLIISLYMLTSCNKFYVSPSSGREISYMRKPIYKGKDTSTTQFSGDYFNGIGVTENERIWNGRATVYKTNTAKWLTTSYGAYIYGGQYSFNSSFREKMNYSILGTGIKAEGQFKIPLNDLQWRILGIKAGVTYERGSYLKNIHYLNSGVVNYGIGGSSELCFHMFNKFDLSIYGAYSYYSSDTPLFAQMFISVSYNRYSFITGIHGSRHVLGYNIGLSYQIY